ncbi:MAG TPA: MATE family efflux transporter [Acidimicrobiales bacterium]|nr:MATE family efflux transporter [Acidimicrobiales bacterium]
MPALRSRHDREIARLAVPAFGALVAEPLYVLADTAVVGRIGTDELAGLAIASSALLTGYAIFIFLAYGTTAAVSRLLGARQEREAAHQAVQGLWLAAAIGVVVTAAVLVLAGPIVELLGGTGAVRTNALIYLRISAIGIVPQLLTFAGTGYLRGLQDTRTPLVVAIAAATANLVIEVVLISGFGFGIGASALSTVIAQTGGALVYLRLITRATSALGAGLAPDLAAIRRLGRAGWDLLVRTVALRASLTVATALAARIGAADVAAHEVAFALWSFLALGLDSIAIAGQAMIGRFLGAGDTATARDVGRRMLELGAAAGLAVGALVLALRPWLPEVFTDDPEVLTLAGFLLLFVAALQPVNGAVFVLDGLLIGAGDMAFLARAMVAAALLVAPLAVAVSVLDLGIGWVWAAITVLMLARLGVLALRWRSGAWAVAGAER